MKRIFLILLAIILGTGYNYAQEDDKFGSDPQTCKMNLSLYKEFVRQKNYVDALEGWRVVFDTCPKATKAIYLDGAKIYKNAIKKSKDEALKDSYVDTLMLIYERRIENFGQKEKASGYQGFDLYKYRKSDYEKAYELMKISVAAGKAPSSSVLQSYMQVTYKMYKEGKIDPGVVVENFSQCSKQIGDMINAQKDTNKVAKYKITESNIEGLFIKSGAANCDVLSSYYTPKFEADKENVELLKTITRFLAMNKCTESELFMKASEALYPIEPSAQAAYNIAILSLKAKNYSKAAEYYKKAIEKEEDIELKSKYTFELARVYYMQSQYASARTYALKAASLKSRWGEPYILIANLYAASSKDCGAEKFEQNAVFWAAVDKLNTAKSVDPSVAAEVNKLIASFKKGFPNKEEAFFKGINEGDTYTVKCWINETTKARF